MNPVEVNLKVKTRIWREGKHWIADCPALGVVVQMDSERAARREFALLVTEIFAMSQADGSFDDLVKHAAKHPETLWEPAEHKSKTVDVNVPVPLSYLAGRHAQQKQASA
ncbi:MAG: hypothetical protein V4709_10205 [Pseudomonadota bacterium]